MLLQEVEDIIKYKKIFMEHNLIAIEQVNRKNIELAILKIFK